MIILRNSLLLLLAGLFSCGQSDVKQYNQLVDRELKSGKKVNDLFMGIALNMPSKDFYVHCWNMNKKGTFMDGSGNTSVHYKLYNGEMKHPADMYFYPEFYQGKIHKMWVRFQYAGWAPWNKELGSDSLLNEVVSLYKKWYPDGNEFIQIKDEQRGNLFVKVDGNRRIIIGLYDDVQVKVDYADLDVEQAQIN
ncbi:hypothetical protein [Pseudocnuella soli]|uniref:hypothetical protein n=1 Tax=Pseudocnuella soli TaxID=2502779 RepID=UPI00104A6545|nr:hypothetical protein [Pseudocnuella soli]